MIEPSKKVMTREEYRKIKKKKKLVLKTWVLKVLIVLFSLTLILSLLKIYFWAQDNKKIVDITKEINEIVTPTTIEEEGELINPPEDKANDYWDYVKLPFYEVDFTALKEKNPDTIAFIHMQGNNINYPVVQTDNNDYYLKHAYDKSKNSAGWVFMDYRNNITNLSDNTVIYGHGRLDETVFGSLKNTLTKTWQANKENYVIWLTTEKENLVFQIFSIYTIASENYYIETDFSSSADKEKWLNTMKERNTTSFNTSVNTNDKILTLSTCQNNNGGRIVVQAKLIKRQSR